MPKDIYNGTDLERLQRTRRVEETEDPISNVGPRPDGPTSQFFSITVSPNSLADLNTDTESFFDRLYIEFTSSDISTGFTAAGVVVICDGILVANLHTGLIVKTKGTRKWQVFNPQGAVSYQIRGYLTRNIDTELRSPIAYGFDSANPNNTRALTFTGNNELIVVMNGAHALEASPLNLNAQTSEARGELLGNAAVVNSLVVAGVATKNLMVTALGIASVGATIGGELIQAQFTFPGAPTAIARLAIKTGVVESDHVNFGDSGPAGNTGGGIRVTIVKPFAIGDGWVAWATARYV